MNRNEGNGKSRDWLSQLAELVADGTPVDWEQQEKAHPEFAQKLNMLRDIQSIGQVCHSGGSLAGTSGSAWPQAAPPPRSHRSESDTVDPAPDSGQPTKSGDPFSERKDLVPHLSTWGHLAFLEKIGEGSFGEVYRAYDSALDLEVALKLLRQAQIPGSVTPERMLKEARCLAHVQHPNVITVHGADVHNGLVGIWTDLLRGRTLEDCLECNGAFGANEAVVIGIELCGALAAIHAAELVHGDVKTTNAMREEGGRIVLMDFGTVRRETPENFSESGVQGTPLTMAPELLLEASPPTRASDIYSLGALLYRLVTRDYPVRARTIKELRDRHRRGEIMRLRDQRPDLPAAFAQVVDKALAPHAKDRFASFAAMEKALCAAVCVAPAVEPPSPNRRRIKRVTAAASALTVAVLAFLYLLPEPQLQVQTAFYKARGEVEELVDASSNVRMQEGEALLLQLENEDDVHLYVFNESADEPGNVYTLFPSKAAIVMNPIPAGSSQRFPYWEFDGRSSEIVLIVASREPRKALEDRMASEFFDGAEPVMMAENDANTAAEAHGTEAGSATDPPAVEDLEIDPEKLADMGLRRLKIRPTPELPSTLETMATRLRDEMKDSKDVWYQIVRIEP